MLGVLTGQPPRGNTPAVPASQMDVVDKAAAADAAVRTITKLMAGFLAIVISVPVAWLIVTTYVERTSLQGDGEVTAKRELIFMFGDTWRRVFEVTYRYQPSGEPYS
ncbi:MAG TPA: hypothetical protein VGY48_14525, partial [Vicinamibacterales bacterium]|nr:hypothetical protein [Vicinamibacterales bacterium]